MSYTRPAVTLLQQLTQLPAAIVASQNALVFGPCYHLFRYAEADEKAVLNAGSYLAEELALAYPAKPAGSVVDTGFVKVYLDTAWLKYATAENSATNPVVAVSPSARHKLRAAPRIAAAEKVGSVVMTSGGYFQGKVGLPEAYYFWPEANFTVDTGAGTLDWVSTEGLTGEMDVPSETTGITVQGPSGLTAVFSSPGAVKAPRIFTFSDDVTSSFTLSLKTSAYPAVIDSALLGSPAPATLEVDTATLAVTLTGYALLLEFEATTTLAQLRTAILADADVMALFDVSALSGGVGGGDAIAVADQDAADVADETVTTILPNVWRVKVFSNDWIWKTTTGYTRNAALLRDVKVGDPVKVTVSPAGGDPEVITSRVTGFETDFSLPVVGDTEASASNVATQAGDDLTTPGAALVVADADNSREFAGTNTLVVRLATSQIGVDPDLADGLVDQEITIEITTPGAKGTALAKVSNVSGTYLRLNVPIEDAGSDDGQIYIGNNAYVNFDKSGGDADAVFQLGDIYSVTAGAPFTAVAAPTSSGEFEGSRDTTYRIEVVRGGLFTRTVRATPGLTNAGVTLTPSLSGWTAGDIDDEYILKCTTAGSQVTAIFSLTSVGGDNQVGINFGGYTSAHAKTIGARGLSAYLAAAGTFVVGQYWVIKVKATRPQIRITDSAGIDQAVTTVVNSGVAISLGVNGAAITFASNANGGLLKGDVFTVECTATAATGTTTLVLAHALPEDVVAGLDASGDANASPDRVQVELFMVRNGLEVPRKNLDPDATEGAVNWVATASELTLSADIKVQDSEWVDSGNEQPFIPVTQATVYPEYRALRTNLTGLRELASGLGGVVSNLGKVHRDNPLALGVYKALENAGSGRVFFMAVATDDLAGYNAALSLATKSNQLYSLAPCTSDAAILSAVRAHVAAQSTKNIKHWRLACFAPETPSVAAVLDPTTNDGDPWLATITDDTRTGGNSYTKVTVTGGAFMDDMAVGDIVRYNYATDAWGDETYDEGVVAEVESDEVFYLETALEAEVAVASRIEVWHTLSLDEIAEAVRDLALSYGGDRYYYCFNDGLVNDGVSYPDWVGGAIIAGLVAGMPPQQGITNTEVTGVTGAPSQYSRFTEEQLDTMAGGGVLILAQDSETGPVYVRHQISTAYADAIPETGELSMVRNRDSVSYYLVLRMKNWIGGKNITPFVLEAMRTDLEEALAYLSTLTGTGTLGPQILQDGSEIVTLAQNATLRDHVDVTLRVAFPPPLNNIDMILEF